MAHNPKFSNLAVNTKVDALAAQFNNGYLRIYDGTQPANADTAVGAQTLLAELRYNATAFGAGVAGVATANALTGDSSANATGTATWFRALKSDGSSVLLDGSVGTSDADLILNSVAIQSGTAVSISSHTITEPKG